MANPSLQIGNRKWAIKEDNLLGYSKVGTRFVPQPITMERASAGTRVNSAGLVETVELLGSEEVTNGDFSGGSTGWTVDNSNADNYVVFDGSTARLKFLNTSPVTEVKTTDAILTSGKTYRLIVDIASITSGAVKVDGNGISELFNTVGLNERIITPTGNASLGFYRATANVDLTFNSVSVKEYTANNLARVDYDGTASSLLVEPQRTNLLPYSEDFSQWSAISGASVAINTAISPNGETDADTITFDGTTYGRVEENIAVTNGNTYTFSVYLKNNNLSDVTQVWIGFSQSPFQGKYVTITNEWQRFETTQVANGSSEYPRVQFTGTGSLYSWGAQLEEGSYPTSYISTDGSTVTRVQDQYSKTGISNLINSEEGVLFLEVAFLSETDPVLQRISINDGTNTNRIIIQANPNNNAMQFYLINSLGQQTSSNYTLANKINFNKIAFKWKVNDFAVWSNGTEVITDTSGTTFSSGILNRITFEGATGSNNFYGKVKQLQVFKTALTDTELATLTT